MKQLFIIASLIIIMAACTTQKAASDNNVAQIPVVAQVRTLATQVPNTVPKAILYRTNKPCADLVPVQVGADGTLISYPAPTDLSASSMPVELPGGWWLDRRGISASTAFTRYTYSEYEALKKAPAPKQIIAAIDTTVHIIEIYRLPMSAAEAAASPSLCTRYIANGFAGCTKIM